MPARVDSGNETYRAIAKRVYSEAFLAQLATTFKFDLNKHNARYELRKIAEAYILGCRDDGGKLQKKLRNRYRQLPAAISRFANLINKFDDDDHIATEMQKVAVFSPQEASYMDDVIAGQKTRGETEFLHRHLLNLLDLLTATAKLRIDFHEGIRGPRKNAGLHAVVMKGQQFWAYDLRRKFSVDYHEGSGLTKAFQFIRALIDPLDDVTDRQIVTALREEIRKQRGGWNKPKPRKRPLTK